MSANNHCDRNPEEVPKMPDPNTVEPEEITPEECLGNKSQEAGLVDKNPENKHDSAHGSEDTSRSIMEVTNWLALTIQTTLLIPCCLCSRLSDGKSYEDPEREEEPKLGTLKPQEFAPFVLGTLKSQEFAPFAQFAQYDIFLSFRGLDVREKFCAYLYDYLEREGFTTFRDDERMEWGEGIKSELHKAILNSRAPVVILSKNFAHSKACLFELQTMVEQSKKSNHRILPVFYEIQPEKIKEQAKCLNFKKHCCFKNKKEREELTRSSASLQQVARMAGVVSKNYSAEPKLITEIIRKLKSKLVDEPLWIGDHLVSAAKLIQRRARRMLKLIKKREFQNTKSPEAYVKGHQVRLLAAARDLLLEALSDNGNLATFFLEE